MDSPLYNTHGFSYLFSEELDRRTKETQKLQDEVENATKLTLERFGCAYGIHCSSSLNGNFNVCKYWRHQIIVYLLLATKYKINVNTIWY